MVAVADGDRGNRERHPVRDRRPGPVARACRAGAPTATRRPVPRAAARAAVTHGTPICVGERQAPGGERVAGGGGNDRACRRPCVQRAKPSSLSRMVIQVEKGRQRNREIYPRRQSGGSTHRRAVPRRSAVRAAAAVRGAAAAISRGAVAVRGVAITRSGLPGWEWTVEEEVEVRAGAYLVHRAGQPGGAQFVGPVGDPLIGGQDFGRGQVPAA